MSHRRGAYTQAGGDGHAGKAGAAGMSGCAGGAAAVLRRHGPGRPGGTGPVRRVGDSGAVPISGGIGAADGPGRRGGSGPGADAAGPGAGLRPRRSRGVSAGPGGQLSCGSPHRGPAVPGEADIPAGGLPPAAVLQQLRPGVYSGRGGPGLLRQSPGRGTAVGRPHAGSPGHRPGAAPPSAAAGPGAAPRPLPPPLSDPSGMPPGPWCRSAALWCFSWRRCG